MNTYKLWISGQWHSGKNTQEVLSPYDGSKVATIVQADAELLELALKSSHQAFQTTKFLSRYIKSQLLGSIARKIEERRLEFVERMICEAGKPRALSEAEVDRAVTTFTLACEEAKRIGGELVPIDLEPASRAFGTATAHWVPRGPVLAITPFNFPLNLVAHKVAPAIAAGCSVILKPPHQAPGCSILLAEIFEQAAIEVSDGGKEKIPTAFLQVVSSSTDAIEKMVSDLRVSTLSFTGSDKVGWMLQQKAARKRVALELGGNAAVIIHHDADLKKAAERCAYGGFAYAGQICISVQRIIVHENVASEFEILFLAQVKKIKVGDPSLQETLVGPLIDRKACERLDSWIKEAASDGARIIVGGKRNGSMMEPTVIVGAKPHHKIYSDEAFGPVVTLETFKTFDEAIEIVNQSRFGLQAGLFTDSQICIAAAFKNLDVGGLIINEIPTFRSDNMPYGGIKDSGLGREGLRYAMQDYSELKTLVVPN